MSGPGFYYIAVDLNPAPSAIAEADWKFAPIAGPYGSSTLAQSMQFSTRRHSDSGSSRTHSGSYASVVRGRSPAASHNQTSSTNDTNGVASKTDDHIGIPSATAPSLPSTTAYSLSMEEFPPHSSPLHLPTPTSCFPFNKRSLSPCANDCTSSLLPSSHFYNARTGYQGPWAYATMKGFYFASSTDPYQELELHYVGDGMGVQLEEQSTTSEEANDWKNASRSSDQSNFTKEFGRRERYARPKGSASFSFL